VRVDQWVPALHRGDAIGDSALLMRDALRGRGIQADVYALDVDDALAAEARPFASFREGVPADAVILHFALPSPLSHALRGLRCRRVLLHHNITPSAYFADYDPELARICDLGRAELGGLRDAVDLGLADSEFNRRELAALGFRRTGVLPICLDFDRYRLAPNPVLLRMLGDGRANLLFVGRIAPNKRIEDLIRLASYWKRFLAPDVRLLLVGKLPRRATGEGRPLPRHYFDDLQSLHYEEGLTPDEVVFLGHVDHADLLACYRSARVFVSMSEHEGFGVPLVEAMLMDVPVLAYRAAAVGDTLGGAGLQFGEKRLAEVAELAFQLSRDRALRERVLVGQRRRRLAFEPARVRSALFDYLRSL
jgi:glycosyltransferase involved in cell wall biosynthesis